MATSNQYVESFSASNLMGHPRRMQEAILCSSKDRQQKLNMAKIDETTARVWLADSGASHHTTFDVAQITTYKLLDKPYIIRQVQGEVKITHWGTVDLITETASHLPIVSLAIGITCTPYK